MISKTFSKFLIFTLLSVSILAFLVLPHLVLGQDFLGELRNAGTNTGLVAGGSTDAGETQITNTIATGIEILLGFVGVLFLILMVYAGFMWMMARGNEQVIEKAKGLITDAVIGLVIVLAAYGITIFVVERLLGGGEALSCGEGETLCTCDSGPSSGASSCIGAGEECDEICDVL